MNISSKQHGSVDVVQLPQRLVMANAAAVRRELLEMVALGHHYLVLDLGGTTFVDSSGLSVLVSALMAANKVNGKVALLNPTNDVRALIELTRMHEVFAIYADPEAAIDQLGQESVA